MHMASGAVETKESDIADLLLPVSTLDFRTLLKQL